MLMWVVSGGKVLCRKLCQLHAAATSQNLAASLLRMSSHFRAHFLDPKLCLQKRISTQKRKYAAIPYTKTGPECVPEKRPAFKSKPYSSFLAAFEGRIADLGLYDVCWHCLTKTFLHELAIPSSPPVSDPNPFRIRMVAVPSIHRCSVVLLAGELPLELFIYPLDGRRNSMLIIHVLHP